MLPTNAHGGALETLPLTPTTGGMTVPKTVRLLRTTDWLSPQCPGCRTYALCNSSLGVWTPIMESWCTPLAVRSAVATVTTWH